jgi:hypothetical protein
LRQQNWGRRRVTARARGSEIGVEGMLTADDVAEVRDVVDVGQRAGDEYVPAAGDRKLRRRRRRG